MKKIIVFIAVSMLLFVGSGCNKDPFFTEEPEVSLKSAEMKTIPIKADIYAVVSEERDGLAYAGNLGGTISHLGELIFEKSTFSRTYFEFREGPAVYWKMNGDVAASNGDVMHYTLWGELNLAKNEYQSTVTYNGGTGRFENVTGYLDLTGYVDQVSRNLIMKGEGMISNAARSKK